MMSLVYVFWMYVLLFAVIGMLRGWAKELLVAFSVVLALALSIPSVSAIANNFLGLFRVQQVTVVQVNPANIPQHLGSSSELESLLSQDVKVQKGGQVQSVTSAEAASQLAGIPVRAEEGSVFPVFRFLYAAVCFRWLSPIHRRMPARTASISAIVSSSARADLASDPGRTSWQ